MDADNYVDIGNNKRIKFGLSWEKDIVNKAFLIVIKDSLSNALRPFESAFIDEFTSTILLFKPKRIGGKFSASIPYKLHFKRNYKHDKNWHLDNPSFDNEKQIELTQIVNKFVEIGILTEIPNNQIPNYLNPIDIIKINNQWKLWPDYSILNSYIREAVDVSCFVEENFFKIPKSLVFSQLVLKDYAYQIMLDTNDRKYTTFKLLKNGQDHYYQFNTFHPNLAGGSIQMQKNLGSIFASINSIQISVDKIFIYSTDFFIHLDLLSQVMNLLYQSNIKLSLNESELFCRMIEYNEFEVSSDGYSISVAVKERIRNATYQTSKDRDWFRYIVFKCLKFLQADRENYRNESYSLMELNYETFSYVRAFNFFKNMLINLPPIQLNPRPI